VLLACSLRNVLRATPACTCCKAYLAKVSNTEVDWGGFNIFTSAGALRHSHVHFFGISTAKIAPRMECLKHFGFQICFARQRLAIFHLSSPQMAPHPPL
jgi:hypothetical protein